MILGLWAISERFKVFDESIMFVLLDLVIAFRLASLFAWKWDVFQRSKFEKKLSKCLHTIALWKSIEAWLTLITVAAWNIFLAITLTIISTIRWLWSNCVTLTFCKKTYLKIQLLEEVRKLDISTEMILSFFEISICKLHDNFFIWGQSYDTGLYLLQSQNF